MGDEKNVFHNLQLNLLLLIWHIPYYDTHPNIIKVLHYDTHLSVISTFILPISSFRVILFGHGTASALACDIKDTVPSPRRWESLLTLLSHPSTYKFSKYIHGRKQTQASLENISSCMQLSSTCYEYFALPWQTQQICCSGAGMQFIKLKSAEIEQDEKLVVSLCLSSIRYHKNDFEIKYNLKRLLKFNLRLRSAFQKPLFFWFQHLNGIFDAIRG